MPVQQLIPTDILVEVWGFNQIAGHIWSQFPLPLPKFLFSGSAVRDDFSILSWFFRPEWAQPPPGQQKKPIDIVRRVLAMCFILAFCLPLAAAVLFTAATESMCWISWHDLNQHLSWALVKIQNFGACQGPFQKRQGAWIRTIS